MDIPAPNITRAPQAGWEAWQYQGIVRTTMLNTPTPKWFDEIPTRKNGEYRSYLWDFPREVEVNDWLVRFDDGPTFKLLTPVEFDKLCQEALALKASRVNDLEQVIRELLPLAINETGRNEDAEKRDNDDYGSERGRQIIATAEALLEGRHPVEDEGDPLDIAFIGIGVGTTIHRYISEGKTLCTGYVELVGDAIRHAPLLTRTWEARQEELDSLVFAYDVAAPFGEWYARAILNSNNAEHNVDAQLLLDLVIERALLAATIKETT